MDSTPKQTHHADIANLMDSLHYLHERLQYLINEQQRLEVQLEPLIDPDQYEEALQDQVGPFHSQPGVPALTLIDEICMIIDARLQCIFALQHGLALKQPAINKTDSEDVTFNQYMGTQRESR